MEFIQCTHCDKKYAVNDRVRAAVDRVINCKICNEKFKVVIMDDSDNESIEIKVDSPSPKSEPKPQPAAKSPNEALISEFTAQLQTPEHHEPQQAIQNENIISPNTSLIDEIAEESEIPAPPSSAVENKHAEKTEPSNTQQPKEAATKPKQAFTKAKLQLYLAIGLGIILVIGIIVLIMLEYTPTPAKQMDTEEQSQVINAPQVTSDPEIQAVADEPTTTENPAEQQTETSDTGDSEVTSSDIGLSENNQQQITETEPAKTDADKYSDVSDECRLAAASQWLIDTKMMHGTYSNKEYVKLLTASQDRSAKIREACQDNAVIRVVLKAATDEVKPAWFAKEIEMLEHQSMDLIFPLSKK